MIAKTAMQVFSAINLSIESMVQTVIYLLVIGGVIWLLLWLVAYINPPEPINKIIRVVIVVFAVLVLIGMLLALIGRPLFMFN